MKDDHLLLKLLATALGAGFLVMFVFSAFPQVDLTISSLFLGADGQFAASDSFAARLSMTIKRLLEGLTAAIILTTITLAILVRRPLSGLTNWIFLSANLVLAPGLLVNGVLKAHFGRARPAQTVEFGGNAQFTSVAEVTDQCSANCSFTSGEAALAATVVFALVALLWPRFGRTGRIVMLIAGGALVILASGLRVGLGRHFTSDVLMSVVFSALIAIGLYHFLKIGASGQTFGFAAFKKDLAAIGSRFARKRLPKDTTSAGDQPSKTGRP